ncbi:hypothetical protein KXW36_009619, partial [Aspergillus fumigatus]
LIGHPEPDLRDFGWAAARADDLANWIPARLSGVLLCLVGGGWRVMARDCRRHASPNAGWPEAAMAGALRARLAGPISYDGVLRDKDWIGDGPPAGVAELGRALWLYRRACTGSDVGKSVLVAGICRALANRGLRVMPFKPQNMSNNPAVTVDGGEIGRAQALQALAARMPLHTDMNPVLLKPQADRTSQLVVHGR